MAKARNPVTLSKQFGINEGRLAQLGVLNATLAIDTSLFVDPILLAKSAHREMREDGVSNYQSYFEYVIRLLAASQAIDDPAWKAARKQLVFPEVIGTCLGYGAGSIHGSGFTGRLTDRVTNVAWQIVHIGITDPDLFQAMALFEAKIGPDRISDMVTNILFPSFVQFNQRVLAELNLVGQEFEYRGTVGSFLVNPFEQDRTPVILMSINTLERFGRGNRNAIRSSSSKRRLAAEKRSRPSYEQLSLLTDSPTMLKTIQTG